MSNEEDPAPFRVVDRRRFSLDGVAQTQAAHENPAPSSAQVAATGPLAPLLEAFVNTDDYTSECEARDALAAMGDDAVPALVSLLTHAEGRARRVPS